MEAGGIPTRLKLPRSLLSRTNSLVNPNLNGVRAAASNSREGLSLLGRDGSVARDELRHDTTKGLNTWKILVE